MVNGKWIKTGAATLLSISVLAGCGSNTEEPEMEQEDITPDQEEEDNVDRETEFEEAPDSEESNEEADQDAKTDNTDEDEADLEEDE